MSGHIERWLGPDDLASKVAFPYLDEFIATNVDIHYETMSETEFWLSVTCRETGRVWHINCGALNSRARGYSRVDRAS